LDGKAATFGLPLGSRQVSRFLTFLTAGAGVAGSKLRRFLCLTTEKMATSSWRHERNFHYGLQ